MKTATVRTKPADAFGLSLRTAAVRLAAAVLSTASITSGAA